MTLFSLCRAGGGFLINRIGITTLTPLTRISSLSYSFSPSNHHRSFLTCSRSLLSSPSLRSSSLSAVVSSLYFCPSRSATKKAGGSVKNKKDSPGRHLGLKAAGGERVKAGRILVRQRGFQTFAGLNVGTGRDQTLFALLPGKVYFTYLTRPFHRRNKRRKYINIINDQIEGGEAASQQQINQHFQQKQEQYLQLLKDKRLGKKRVTVKAAYLTKVREEEQERIKRDREAMIQRVHARRQQQQQQQQEQQQQQQQP